MKSAFETPTALLVILLTKSVYYVVLAVSGLNWSTVECSLGIICVSIPLLRPLVAKMLPKWNKKLSTNPSTERLTESKQSASRYKLRSLTTLGNGTDLSQTHIIRKDEVQVEFESANITSDHFGDVRRESRYMKSPDYARDSME